MHWGLRNQISISKTFGLVKVWTTCGGIDQLRFCQKSSLDAVNSIQLGLYGLAAQLEGYTVEKMAFYNLEDNSAAETDRIREDSIREKVLEVAAGIRDGDFSPTTGFHCRNCGYRSLCPATVERVFAPDGAKVAKVSA